jgi:hypothetical protein
LVALLSNQYYACECPTFTLNTKIADGALLWQTHHTMITTL